jgi:hypothetical protein
MELALFLVSQVLGLGPVNPHGPVDRREGVSAPTNVAVHCNLGIASFSSFVLVDSRTSRTLRWRNGPFSPRKAETLALSIQLP